MKINLPGPQTSASLTSRGLAGLLALVLFLSASIHALAQERFLFVFDTSAAMKKRLPAVETELKVLFVSNLSNNLQSGDSVAVWTFGGKVHAGEFPLMNWQPANGMAVVTNMMDYVRKQDFWGETHFEPLQTMLDRVIAHSERLTIVIFCDGDGQIFGTPYDDGINESMGQAAEERKKHHQPELMILRTQRGKYVGATVTFPPSLPIVPPFPPPPVQEPAAPAPVPAVPVSAPAPPEPSLPPLIIVGTSAGTDITAVARFAATNQPVRPKVFKPKPMVINPEPSSLTATGAVVAALTTNPVVSPVATPVISPATNLVAPPAATPVAILSPTNATPTNSMAGTVPGSLDSGTKTLLAVGAVFFVAAAALVTFLVARKRRPRATLITSLMSDDPRLRK